jgi:hypothetical protein
MAPTSGQREAARRREMNTIKIKDPSVCYNCKIHGLEKGIEKCPACGFPQGGAQNEQRKFLLKKREEAQILKLNKGRIKRAKIPLYILSAIFAYSGFAFLARLGFRSELLVFSVITFAVAGVYFFLGYNIEKNPRLYSILGLGLFLLMKVGSILGSFKLSSGVIFYNFSFWDLVILGILIMAVYAAFKVRPEKDSAEGDIIQDNI